MSTVEDYVLAYATCKRISERIVLYQKETERFLYSMGESGIPSAVPASWMSREEMAAIVEEAKVAWGHMTTRFASIPDDLKVGIVHPQSVRFAASHTEYRYKPPLGARG